jgi:hypothetical protein
MFQRSVLGAAGLGHEASTNITIYVLHTDIISEDEHYQNSETGGSHGGEYEYGCFLPVSSVRNIALVMEEASTSESSDNLHHSTQCNNSRQLYSLPK